MKPSNPEPQATSNGTTEAIKEAKAAVSVICFPAMQGQYLLIKRAPHPHDPWSGHLAFPGGMKEPQDEGLLETAIRETKEECGIHLKKEYLKATIEPMVAGKSVGKYLVVQPYVFTVPGIPQFTLQASEICKVLWVSPQAFTDSGKHEERAMVKTLTTTFPGFAIDGEFLWGFSYKVLRKVLGMD
jgi:8-oxo-dGTP pyrophosphatase MutT (NUDIX family)